MNLHTVRLDILYSAVSEDKFLKIINKFKPAHHDKDAETYLKTKAIKNIKNSKSITFLSIDDKGDILGYYTLAMTFVPVMPNDRISNTLKKKMGAVPINDEKGTYISVAYLIGQLARSVDTPKGFGEKLLREAISTIANLSKHIGCKIIRIDCTNNEKMIDYYRNNGFIET